MLQSLANEVANSVYSGDDLKMHLFDYNFITFLLLTLGLFARLIKVWYSF